MPEKMRGRGRAPRRGRGGSELDGHRARRACRANAVGATRAHRDLRDGPMSTRRRLTGAPRGSGRSSADPGRPRSLPSPTPPSSARSPVSVQPLRVGVIGAGTVGREVVRAFLERSPRLASADGAPLVLAAVAEKFTERAIASGIPEALLTDAPAHLIAGGDVDIVVETMGGARAGPHAHPRRPGRRQARRHREQARHRPLRPGAGAPGPRDRRDAPVRGGRRRRHPAARADRPGPRRQPDQPGARDRQRHDQLHPHRDGPRGSRLRGGPRGGPGPRVRGGRSDRGRRGPRRPEQARDPRPARVRGLDRSGRGRQPPGHHDRRPRRPRDHRRHRRGRGRAGRRRAGSCA